MPVKFLLFLSAFTFQQIHAQQLVKVWETDSVFKVPESVLPDVKNKVLYVSNIDGLDPWAKDRKGSIGKIGLNGEVIAAEWVKGLNAPKGMGIYKNYLYVADLTEVVVIDLKEGSIKKRIPVQNSEGLNDITIDPKGMIYVSDSKARRIYRIKGNDVSVFLESLQSPNGVLWYNDALYILDKGGLYRVEYDRRLTRMADGMEGGTDGVEAAGKNEFIVSCWAGAIYYVHADGTKSLMLDTRSLQINSADIGFDPVSRILYVPTFWKNRVMAYELR